jgi:hypothetical protein
MLDSDVFYQCKKNVLSDMQIAAFERENDAVLLEKCKQFVSVAPAPHGIWGGSVVRLADGAGRDHREVPAAPESAHTSSRKSARNPRIELITRGERRRR